MGYYIVTLSQPIKTENNSTKYFNCNTVKMDRSERMMWFGESDNDLNSFIPIDNIEGVWFVHGEIPQKSY